MDDNYTLNRYIINYDYHPNSAILKTTPEFSKKFTADSADFEGAKCLG